MFSKRRLQCKHQNQFETASLRSSTADRLVLLNKTKLENLFGQNLRSIQCELEFLKRTCMELCIEHR